MKNKIRQKIRQKICRENPSKKKKIRKKSVAEIRRRNFQNSRSFRDSFRYRCSRQFSPAFGAGPDPLTLLSTFVLFFSASFRGARSAELPKVGGSLGMQAEYEVFNRHYAGNYGQNAKTQALIQSASGVISLLIQPFIGSF